MQQRQGDGDTWRPGKPNISVTMLLVGGALVVAPLAAAAGTGPETGPRSAVVAAAPNEIAQGTEMQRYDVPAGPLAPALNRFADNSGLQLVYDAEVTAGLRTDGVNGTFTREQALRRLLSGTGITYRYATDDTIALSRPTETGSGAITLGPITVTGERTTRSLRDTASSVQVFDAEDIENRPGVESTNDLMDRLANVTTSGTGNFAPAVRGVDGTGPAQGADAFFAGTRPRLTVQTDGRPVSYNEVIFGDISLWDTEQVEVLRGPQSTLQGRNAIAGTVVIKTKDPTYDVEAGTRGMAGNLDMRQGSAFVSGPLIDDQLAVRLAIDRQERESPIHFQEFRGYDPKEFETTTLRGKLLIEPKALDAFSALVTVNHSDHTGPQAEFVARPFANHVSSTPEMPIFNPRSTSGTVDATYELSDNLSLEFTTSATDLLVKRHAPVGLGNVKLEGREFVAEPRVRFSGVDGKLTGLVGLYAFRATQDEFIDFPSDGTFDDKTTTLAAFGEATYAVLDDVDVTLGARLEQEHRRRTGGAGVFSIDLDETYSAFLPKLGIAWHVTDPVTVGAVVSRGYNGGGAGFTYNAPFQSYTFDPEYVWTYEAYTRADLLDNKLNLTGNVFVSRYEDMQLPFDLNPDPSVWSTVVRNADEVVTYGAEFGARWLAMPGLEVFGDVGLLQTEVTENPGSGVEGHDLAFAPAFTANAGFAYTHESGIEFSTDARFSEAYFSSIENEPRERTEPYFVVNTKLGYRKAGERIDLHVFGFVNNVFDSEKPVFIDAGATSASDVANLLQTRTFGVGLELTF